MGQRAVDGRAETGVTLEYLIQTRKVAKTDHLGYLGDRDVIGGQKHFGLLQTYLEEIVPERNSHDLAKPVGEMIFAHSDLAR